MLLNGPRPVPMSIAIVTYLIFPRQTVAQPPFLQECLRIVHCFKQCRDVHEIDVPCRSRKIGTAADSSETRQIQPSLSVHCRNETQNSESIARVRAVRGLFRLILADLRRPRYFISQKKIDEKTIHFLRIIHLTNIFLKITFIKDTVKWILLLYFVNLLRLPPSY